MRLFILGALALAACGPKDDRLIDEQAATVQNVAAEPPAAIDRPLPPSGSPVVAAYKAVGTEPGWALTIRSGTMNYEGDYGSVKISEPAPANFRPAPGLYAGTRLKLTITPGPCSDGMSDLVYRQTVRLTADGKTVDGCGGGTVASPGVAGTSWAVAAINGRPTPGGTRYFVNFTDNRISAGFGCNNFSGNFRLNGDHLSTHDLHATEMACGEPAMSHERQGGAILSSNMRVERIDGTLMRLVSEVGSIDLRRAI